MNKQTDEDLLRLRAQARAALLHRDPRKPAYIEIQFVGIIGNGLSRSQPNWNFDHAEIYEQLPADEPVLSFERGDESVDAFRARVISELPAISKVTWTVILSSPDVQAQPEPESVQ